MSSLLAHVVVGASLYLCNDDSSQRRSPAAVVLPVSLAILPDFDYFAIWFLGVRFEQRYTHSLFFCLAMSCLAWLMTRRWCRSRNLILSFWLLLLASCSHLLLDLLVGRCLPLLWPFSVVELCLPVAVLPGAAHTGLISYVFWRNLAIESCLLLPVCVALIASVRRLSLRRYVPEIILVLTMWLGLLFCSSSLTTM
ncbi:metal-dependent hydrolase [Undibacterium sp. CY18W]|uniref:Metal-dependent hydrolase n=1 Tax=Undibacterium hunanense TaxID=2762292 RepID=A0ABR6ZQ02_9BURK|nr:metal-dependent hydrolase [Undibacterium hunanense]